MTGKSQLFGLARFMALIFKHMGGFAWDYGTRALVVEPPPLKTLINKSIFSM